MGGCSGAWADVGSKAVAFAKIRAGWRAVPRLEHGAGHGDSAGRSPLTIRLGLRGCANRPFYHVVLTKKRHHLRMPVIEQLGSYDPMPNVNNEKLVGLNYERVKYWVGRGADLSGPVREILGLSGFLPVYPPTYMKAWRARRAAPESPDSPEA